MTSLQTIFTSPLYDTNITKILQQLAPVTLIRASRIAQLMYPGLDSENAYVTSLRDHIYESTTIRSTISDTLDALLIGYYGKRESTRQPATRLVELYNLVDQSQ